MVAIDAFASSPWYVDHIRPIWLALPDEARGTFYVSAQARRAANGLPNVTTNLLTHGGPILTVSYGDYRAAAGRGRTLIALGQHGAGQSYSKDHKAYPGGRDQGQVSLFLVPNEHAAARTRKAYPGKPVTLVGCPKVDTLPRKPDRGRVVAVSFHWSGSSISPELRSAFPYYRDVLGKLARTHQVIGHAHPRSMSEVGRWYRRIGVEVVPSFDEVLRRADVYVCDNSSSMFEFAATGRGVVVLNTPDYRPSAHHGLRFWDAAGVGVNCGDPGQLAACVDRALDDPPEVAEARERALDIVYQPRTGGARIAAEALAEWSRQPAPDPSAELLRRIQARAQVRQRRLYQRTRPSM